jgi:hypothetical protein
MVVGDVRMRAQRALDSLYAQTIAASIEVIVIDLKSRDVPPLTAAGRTPTRYVTPGAGTSWAEARALGVRMAAAPIVAFLEDHCTAEPEWAAALVRAHEQPWAAVGYAFTNPHPDSYVSRAMLESDYGCWAHPTVSHPARLLPCGNVAYKRDLLLSLGAALEVTLTPDRVLHEQFNRRGLDMYVESQAIVAHDSLVTLSGLTAASFLFCRIFGARRAQTQKWSAWKRIAYGLATPAVSPLVALGRLMAARRRTQAEWGVFISYLPVVLAKSLSSALGESVGYLRGEGTSEAEFNKWELHVDRSGER